MFLPFGLCHARHRGRRADALLPLRCPGDLRVPV